MRAPSLLFALSPEPSICRLRNRFPEGQSEWLTAGHRREGSGPVPGLGRGGVAPAGPQAAPRPSHRISWASSTHFQCSTGLSFSCSTVSSCCSPALSAGPPAGTEKGHSRAPQAHNPLKGPGVLGFPSDPGQGLPLCFFICEMRGRPWWLPGTSEEHTLRLFTLLCCLPFQRVPPHTPGPPTP